METAAIANRLVELLRFGEFEKAVRELFDVNSVSIEPEASKIPVFKGLDAILAKGIKFRDSVEEWHGISVSDPISSTNFFSISLQIELIYKGQNEKTVLDEIILYKVANGKIVQEEFFY